MPFLPTLLRLPATPVALIFLLASAGCSAGGGSDGPAGEGPGAPPQGETATAGAYLPDDGLVVVEFESGSAAGSWAEETPLTGFTGASYLTWSGANMYSNPGVDAFGFDVWIEDAGNYSFRIHNRHDHPDSTLANDLWVRMDGGDWVKAYSWQRGQWTWVTNHEFSSSYKPEAAYDLDSGNHRIEFSGRSTDFSVDRFHLYDAGVVDPLNTSHPESSRAGVSGATPGPGSAGLISADAGRTSLVSLDAHTLTDLAAGLWLSSVTWKIPGASFADGTTENSIDPVVVVAGGTALPVRLTLVNEDGQQDVWCVLNVEHAPARAVGELFVDGTVELHLGPDIESSIEIVGPVGEHLDVQAIQTAEGMRVTLRPTSPGTWTYRGVRAESGAEFRGAFLIVAR